MVFLVDQLFYEISLPIQQHDLFPHDENDDDANELF